MELQFILDNLHKPIEFHFLLRHLFLESILNWMKSFSTQNGFFKNRFYPKMFFWLGIINELSSSGLWAIYFLTIRPPGPFRRWLALYYCELTQREVEYLSLSRDTTEADIKQRREIRNKNVVYIDQCAVVAAIKGRVLILEGLEKCERNVLPVLNNLLENRYAPNVFLPKLINILKIVSSKHNHRS